ncbi:MAG: UDP-N-acetylmuramoyl-L-alanyl-D-glutamate--2,6-diaminopimelate ligase [Thermoleophilia bacterium]|nr:UDP-N-acetylmuramoyl-L-alanyl-D-glutamate--2,6-diaminopimelate ligase [Thermoleophilia bacterium]
MRLLDLTGGVPRARLRDADDVTDIDIAAIRYRSADVTPGDAFACLPGERVDGHDFAFDAVARGAVALIVERPLDLSVPQVVVPDARVALALWATCLAGDPSGDMTVVGITGTNGKTTSVYLMHAVFVAAGMRAGMIGTVENRVGGTSSVPTHTTPESTEIQGLLTRMRDAGDTACAMEVSSHALAQSRVVGLRFAAVLFTNLTRDHLDYHGDEESYFRAKRRLFDSPEGDGPNPPGTVNVDDPAGRRLAAEFDVTTFGIDARGADVGPETLSMGPDGFIATVRTPRGPIVIKSALRGRFNVSNVLGIIAVGELLGIDHAAVQRGIASVRGVPGRLEPVDMGQPFQVLVDYAHTPDSLHNVLRTARDLAGDGRLIVLFGCGGDRDTGKRPQMGAIGRALADVCIVTSDNPRSESPQAIIDEIVAGAREGSAEMVVEVDRRVAITAAITTARPGDVVLIAGKGHESGQETMGVVTPFDDRAVARDVLGARTVA